MNNIFTKCIFASALLVACLLPVATRGDGSRGHHPRSEIFGQAYVIGYSSWLNGPLSTTPIRTHITIYSLPPIRKNTPTFSTTGKYVTDIETDEDGNFVVDLKPGSYLLVPDSVPDLLSTSTIVVVEGNKFTSALIFYGYPFVTN